MSTNTTTQSKRTLILGAMTEEIQALLEVLDLELTNVWNGFTIYEGTMDGVPVVICKSGIGKVFASMIVQRILDCYSIDRVIFTGVAGAIAGDLEPGDIVLGETLVHHDFDVAGLGFEVGHIPFTDYRFFEADKELLKRASIQTLGDVKLRKGRIGTGDQFVTEKDKLPDLQLDCVDMEGAAVAQVCTVNQIPFLIIRIISDRADGSAEVDFSANLPQYAHRSILLITELIQQV